MDYCLIYFQKYADEDCTEIPSTESDVTFFYLGNWILHQFILNFGDKKKTNTPEKKDDDFVRDYFNQGIGWKFLVCLKHFIKNNRSIYNSESGKIIFWIHKLFVLNQQNIFDDDYSSDSEHPDFYQKTYEYLSKTNFQEDVYLKTLRNPTRLSPAKVKSWYRNGANSRNLNVKRHHSNRIKKNEKQDANDSDSDDNRPVSDTLIVNRMKNKDFLSLYLRYKSKKSTEKCDNNNAMEFSELKPKNFQLLKYSEEILINFILFERNKATLHQRVPRISSVIVEEASKTILDLFLVKDVCWNSKIHKMRSMKKLLAIASLIECINLDGQTLVPIQKLVASLSKMIMISYDSIKAATNLKEIENLSPEMMEIILLLIRIMIMMCKSISGRDEIIIFHQILRNVFNDRFERILDYLFSKPDIILEDKNQFAHQLVDQLKELQIIIQFSQSLSRHKQYCSKKRHNLCNLVPLMTHHYRENERSMVQNDDKTSTKICCSTSLVYCYLIKILFWSFQHRQESENKLVCHVCNQLANLITCCCSLKKYCKKLLQFVIDNHHSNLFRVLIFNIIEFNVKIQRNQSLNDSFSIDQCEFCSNQTLSDADILDDNQTESINSEGYSTDNGNSLTISDDLKSSTQSKNHSPNNPASCFIKSLSDHYMTLLKSRSSTIRQTVFQHLFTMFSYLNQKSKQSILLNFILPIFENYQNYSHDVIFFILNLLTVLTRSDSPKTDHYAELLKMIEKIDAFSMIKKFSGLEILQSNWNRSQESIHCADMAHTSFKLLENLVKCELNHFLKSQPVFQNLNGYDCDKKFDPKFFTIIRLLNEVFIEQLNYCIKLKIVKQLAAKNKIIEKTTVLNELIEQHKSIGFDCKNMKEQERKNLEQSFYNLSKLSLLMNNILMEFPCFRTILNHDSFGFSMSLDRCFRNLFKMAINEMKLFSYHTLLNSSESSDVNNYGRIVELDFMKKLSIVIERLLFLLVNLKPYCDDVEFDSQHISAFISLQLSKLIEAKHLSCESIYSIDLIGEWLTIFINVSFNHIEHLDLEREFETINDSDSVRSNRTYSFDSIISENDTSTELISFDVDQFGYEADNEFSKISKRPNTQESSSDCTSNYTKISLSNFELCRVVLKFLSDFLQNRVTYKTEFNHYKLKLNMVTSIINRLILYSKENELNNQIFYENNMVEIILDYFKTILISNSSEEKPLKNVLYKFFIQLSQYQLRSNEIKKFIELFSYQDPDFDHLLPILNQILFRSKSDQNDFFTEATQSLRFPAPKFHTVENIDGKQECWIDKILTNIDNKSSNCDCDIAFKLFGLALPIDHNQLYQNHSMFKQTLTFWISFEKILSFTLPRSNHGHNNSKKNSKEPFKFQQCHQGNRQIHVITLVLDCILIEIWLDYIFNRFIYRFCKENNGKIYYLNEIAVNINYNSFNLNRWNFLSIDLDEECDDQNRSHSFQITHSVNCSMEKTFKWIFPANLYKRNSNKNALLIGSIQEILEFSYRLNNVSLFKEMLPISAKILLQSLGPDFGHFHHLEDDCIQRDSYLSLSPHSLHESNVETISSFIRNSSIRRETKSIVENLSLLFQATKPEKYLIFLPDIPSSDNNGIMSSLKFLSFNNQKLSKKSRNNQEIIDNFARDSETASAKIVCTIRSNEGENIAKIISDSGGISIFIFMFLFVLEKSDSSTALTKAMEILLNSYRSHYYHQLMFDQHFQGLQLLVNVLEKSSKFASNNLLKIFSQFVIHNKRHHSIILSKNIGTFLKSWKIWINSFQALKQFFQIISSLISESNPYRNLNLAFLNQSDASTILIQMIEDLHLNRTEYNLNNCDNDLIKTLVGLIKTIGNSLESDPNQLKKIFDCILLLQSSESLHINQTKGSFYYLCPSTWLKINEITEKIRFKIDAPEQSEDCLTSDKIETIDDWEIVSNIFTNSTPLMSEIEEKSYLSSTVSSIDNASSQRFLQKNLDKIVRNDGTIETLSCELIWLLNQYCDHIVDTSVWNACLPEDITPLEFFIILINNPVASIRETALLTFFKFYKNFQDSREPNYQIESSIASSSSLNFMSTSNESNTLKDRTLYLMMVSNQLYNHPANERMMNICLQFLFDLSPKKSSEILEHSFDSTLFKKLLLKISPEYFIPFLAILPNCTHSLSFCHQILSFFYRMVSKLSVEQIFILQNVYGLVQSVSNLIINLNTQINFTLEDMNKFTIEHLNEEIYRIVSLVGLNYIVNGKQEYFNSFSSLLDCLSFYESKTSQEISKVFRESQISICQAAFNALDRIQSSLLERKRKDSGTVNTKIRNFNDYFLFS